MKQKILVPCYGQHEFENEAEAVKSLIETNRLELYIQDIVRYNVEWRNYLREHGYETTKARLVELAPELKGQEEALEELDKWNEERAEMSEVMDIQCCDLKADVEILGHVFHGPEEFLPCIYRNGDDGFFLLADKRKG